MLTCGLEHETYHLCFNILFNLDFSIEMHLFVVKIVFACPLTRSYS